MNKLNTLRLENAFSRNLNSFLASEFRIQQRYETYYSINKNSFLLYKIILFSKQKKEPQLIQYLCSNQISCSSYSWSKCCKKDRSHETRKNIRIKYAESSVDIKYKINTIHNQLFIVNQINFSFRHLHGCMFGNSCAHTFDFPFDSSAIFRTVSNVKEKGCFGQNFCTFKIFFE